MKSNTVKKRIVNIDYEKNKISWIYYLPLLLIAGFVPLIVCGKYVDLTGTTQALYWTGQNQLLDFFSYWKSRWVIFLTATALIIYIFLTISKKLPFKKEYKYYMPLGIYAFFVILSTIFAIDVPTALNGFVDMYQGMWVLLSYVTITFLVINFVNSERDVKLFLYAFIFLIIIEGLIGVGQYFGFDIFNTKFGNSLIIPSGVTVDGGLKFNFGKHTIYGTLFNTNFVGSFATLMLPMAVVFLISAKTVKKRVVASVALILCLFTWIGCSSRAGYVGVAFSVLVAVVMLRKYLIKYWKMTLISVTVGIIGLTIFNEISDGKFFNQISKLNIFSAIEEIRTRNENEDVFRIKEIDVGQNYVKIDTNYQDLYLKILDGRMYFLDSEENTLPVKIIEDDWLEVDVPGCYYFRVKPTNEYSGFSVKTMWEWFGELRFYLSDDEIKMFGCGNRLVLPIVAETFEPLIGLESLASTRGYIWGRTIPLLSKYFFIGSGLDNYPIAFPQDDFVAKLNAGMLATTVIDKPHNMYLQIAINSGVISLVVLLIVWFIYVIYSVRLYWQINFSSLDKYLGLACLLSVIGYLVAGIFNDHIISIAPLFWITLGLGISINIRLNRKCEVDG